MMDSNESKIRMYSMKELQNIMGIGKNTAYKLVKLKGFPSIKIGNKILIPHNKLYDWIEKIMVQILFCKKKGIENNSIPFLL